MDSRNLDDQISDFIQGIRIQSGADKGEPQPSTSNDRDDQAFNELVEEAKQKSKDLIIGAEKFKDSTNPPPGMVSIIGPAGLVMTGPQGVMDMDDQFFHVTCHVDQGLKDKIAKGEFVDLEKLLPKIRTGRTENKLDLVYRDGQSFFVPAQTEIKINGIRRWEQAFRIYAAIYSQANPTWAAEIWQYVHVINTAANSYVWENVASYDYTFRQLKSHYPQRNWAKIYNQMWSM